LRLRRIGDLAAGRRYLVALLLLTVALGTPKLGAADEIEYFGCLRSAVFGGDIDFSNEYRHFYDLNPVGLGAKFRGTFLDLPDPITGFPQNLGPLGSALLCSPIYRATRALVLGLRALGLGVVADGYSAPSDAANQVVRVLPLVGRAAYLFFTDRERLVREAL
jgi:hypothetical protein